MAVVDQAELARIRVQLPRVFTPGAPISRKELLAGRREQIEKIVATVARPGQHAIIYGERGVGKTSLAGLVHQFWFDDSKDDTLLAVRINCDPLDDYATVWANVAEEMQFKLLKPKSSDDGDNGRDQRLLYELDDIVTGQATPNIVRRMFQASDRTFIVVIDEFDRLHDQESVGLMADTLKGLSDHDVNATLIIVGVADSVDDLIHEHASIDRALIQVLLPRMDTDELDTILSNGLGNVGMTIDARARAFIVRTSQGLPYYGHLLGLTSALATVARDLKEIEFHDVVTGLTDAVDNAEATIANTYYQATVSSRANLNKEVLLACSLAPVDELGYFQPAAVATPLESIIHRECRMSTYIRHLDALVESERGKVLQKRGDPRRHRYRFRDPLLKPYIILRGLQDGLISPD